MFDLISLIKAAGYIGMFGILFAETGLLVGVVLPGDSLLFTAGFLASQGFMSIGTLCLVTFLGAVIGDNTGYWLGRYFGPRIFSRPESLFFKPRYVAEAHKFFERYGSKTVILARFIPVIRTFAPPSAGVGSMDYRVYLPLSLVGGGLWAVGVPVAGYYLGSAIPGVDRYLLPIVVLIVLISVLPGVIHVLRDEENRHEIMHRIRALLRMDK
jgi:membrane-associated protein